MSGSELAMSLRYLHLEASRESPLDFLVLRFITTFRHFLSPLSCLGEAIIGSKKQALQIPKKFRYRKNRLRFS